MIELGSMYRGNSEYLTLTLARTEPAVDLQEDGTEIDCYVRSMNQDRFEKTIGAGVSVISATQAIVTFDPADTANLPTSPLSISIKLTEPNGRVTTLDTWGLELK